MLRRVGSRIRSCARRLPFADAAFELIEFFLGPLPEARRGRQPDSEVAAAEAAGLEVDLHQTSLRMEIREAHRSGS